MTFANDMELLFGRIQVMLASDEADDAAYEEILGEVLVQSTWYDEAKEIAKKFVKPNKKSDAAAAKP